ncbi:hypothetical protein [Brevibacterium spongiae]|uniref:Uncharacterized protein n=1 Tax=Brevibacterium spongiae TaxID=2909672 RepID=A0ABY5SW47_9MICO|nr:hypothetical protein [Brevibacterium spongiae]UVI37321.1 hypothetical protein L1F31_06655 [Brevibacterium spongiae]
MAARTYKDEVIVHCSGDGYYRTRWIPFVSFKSIRFGAYRFQRCPVHDRWELAGIVDDEDLTTEIRAEADRYPASRIP